MYASVFGLARAFRLLQLYGQSKGLFVNEEAFVAMICGTLFQSSMSPGSIITDHDV